jgi:uncharacterized protein (TIGR02145 family)
MIKKKNNWIFYWGLCSLLLVFSNSCKKDQVPVITTNDVISITLNTACCGGNISSDGGTSITEKGVCWSTEQLPTIDDSKTSDGIDEGSFTSTITGLNPSTTYYVRAYATNKAGTGYGKAILFATQLDSSLTMTDLDGNIYHIITIGTQVWTVENLKVTHYRNGDSIPKVTNDTAWVDLTTGALCDYGNVPDDSTTYGKLYNWYSIVDPRNLCPPGWHVSTKDEWRNLSRYLGGETFAGGKLKESGTTHWASPNNGADNSSGFTALPSGRNPESPDFFKMGYFGYYWSSTTEGATDAWNFELFYNRSELFWNLSPKCFGLSIRCVKD